MMLCNVQARSRSELEEIRRALQDTGSGLATASLFSLPRSGKENLSTQTNQDGGIYRLTIADGKWKRVATLDGIHVADQANESF